MLVFVQWYKKAVGVDKSFCHVNPRETDEYLEIELYESSFFDISWDCIIPIHRISGTVIAGLQTGVYVAILHTFL